MVGYGSALRRARRPGWEDAYLDYESLKLVLEKMEEQALRQDQEQIQSWLGQQQEQFFTRLQLEIEKTSLFALSKQGELANSVGSLRFENETKSTNKKSSMFSYNTPSPATTVSSFDDDTEPLALTGEHAALLPPLGRKKSIREIKSSTAPQTMDEMLDTYTCLGVELLHLIRYICVNAMGIRKILKKYDKLMLLLNTKFDMNQQEKSQDELALLPSNSMDGTSTDNHRHATVVNIHETRGGGPDDHFQQLANSASIAAIHASLYAAFVDCKESKDKVDISSPKSDNRALPPSYQKHHQRTLSPFCFEMGQIVQEEELLSESSLIRLECAVTSIQTLRECAQLIVNQPFGVFLSRKAMIVTGRDRNGNLGGLEGTGMQKALEVLLRFQPDSIRTMNDQDLSNWQEKLVAMLATSNNNRARGKSRGLSMDSGDMDLDHGASWGGVDSKSMAINLMSTLLYTVNYYIVAPTANHYAILLGTDGAFGATLVGASSLAALFAAFLYSVWYTRSSFQSALIFSAACPCLGNLLYSLAMSYGSMSMAIWGRILVGFGSAEVVNRQLISACVSFAAMTKACALFVAAGAAGMSVGPLLAAILDEISGRDVKVDLSLPGMPAGGIIYNHVTSPGFVMAILWFLEIVALWLLFSEPNRVNGGGFKEETAYESSGNLSGLEDSTRSNGDVESAKYGAVDSAVSQSVSVDSENGYHTNKGVCSRYSAVSSQLDTVRRLVFANMALPVTLLLFAYIELVDEVLISSCSMVCRRYFGWHASRAGLLIASLGALVLPAHFVVERASHIYEERSIMKNSIVFICVSLFGILNYTGFLYDTVGLGVEVVENIESDNLNVADDTTASTKDETMGGISKSIASLTNKENEFSYDWGIGTAVYIFFLSAVFMGTIILEGVDTSLMSKTTPSKLNDTIINSGLLATLVGTLGRVGGDSMITISALVDKSVFTDFVNATFFPLIPMAFLGYYLVRRYYKLLM